MMLQFITKCFVLLAICRAASAQYCELTVLVEDHRGASSSAEITVTGAARVQRATAVKGVAHICDIGFEPFTLSASWSRDCPVVTIQGLKHRWFEPLKVKVVLPDCDAEERLLPSMCVILLRGITREQQIPESLQFHGLPRKPQPQSADKFGRAVAHLDYGQSADIKATAPGYEDVPIKISCDKNKPEVEYTVVLTGIPKRQ